MTSIRSSTWILLYGILFHVDGGNTGTAFVAPLISALTPGQEIFVLNLLYAAKIMLEKLLRTHQKHLSKI